MKGQTYKNSGKLLKINVTSSRIPQAQFLIFRDRFLDKVYAPIYGARTPGGKCPGGSLQKCMDLCPSSPPEAYQKPSYLLSF